MPKWKLQAVEPDTCESPGCRYIELWDSLSDILTRTFTIVAFDRVCSAHQTDIPTDKILWEDGNWKPKKEYIEYQRKWFRRLNHVEWLINNPDEPMPKQISKLTQDPITTGSIVAPPQIEIDGMNRAYNWNKADNLRKNNALNLTLLELGLTKDEENRGGVIWSFTGSGDNRVLNITDQRLNSQQVGRIQSALNIQFGPGKIITGN